MSRRKAEAEPEDHSQLFHIFGPRKDKKFFYAKMEKQTRNDSKRFMSVTSEIIKHCHTLNRITNTFIFVISAQDPKYFNLQSLSIYKMDHWDIGPWLWLMW